MGAAKPFTLQPCCKFTSYSYHDLWNFEVQKSVILQTYIVLHIVSCVTNNVAMWWYMHQASSLIFITTKKVEIIELNKNRRKELRQRYLVYAPFSNIKTPTKSATFLRWSTPRKRRVPHTFRGLKDLVFKSFFML